MHSTVTRVRTPSSKEPHSWAPLATGCPQEDLGELYKAPSFCAFSSRQKQKPSAGTGDSKEQFLLRSMGVPDFSGNGI